MRLQLSLLVLLLVLSTGCNCTRIVMRHPHGALKAAAGEHELSLPFQRIRIEEDSPLQIPVLAVNKSGLPWVVTSGMFSLEESPTRPGPTPPGQTILTLPPQSSGKCTVVFPPRGKGEYYFFARDNSGSSSLLIEDRLTLADYSPSTQAGRFLLVILALIGIAAL